ncbi:MAG: ABC transporter ATP-binding protein [Synechococcales cyanobacterium RM1_1_8]|nr:ABC transporter ATP-binding protein [Synechococcales cyanobacterium RM1_1_8]
MPALTEKPRQLYQILLQTGQLIWRSSRSLTALWAILLLLQGLIPVGLVYLTRFLIDALVRASQQNWSQDALQPLLMPGGLFAGLTAINFLLQSASSWVRTAQSELLQDYVSDLIHQKSIEIDYGCYESSEYNNKLSRAREGASGRSLALLESAGGLLQGSLSLFAIAFLLLSYGLLIPAALIVSTLPAFFVALKLSSLQYNWSQRTTLARRKTQYYELVLTNNMMAGELRLFNFGAHFRQAYQQVRKQLRLEQLALIRQQSLSSLGASLVSGLLLLVLVALLGRDVLKGGLSLGELAMFQQAFVRGQGIVKSLLSNLNSIYRNSLFIGNLFEFLAIQPSITDPQQPKPTPKHLESGIALKDVDFRYPGCNDYILKGFNLVIPAGKVVAIVGDNGAGKSTLIKLLCRFYDVESGCITFDGIDVRQFRLNQFRALITVLFQFPITYQLDALSNISLSDLERPQDIEAIEDCAKASGIHGKLKTLPAGYHTQLGKWFPDGVDLSGGQWQRLALARAFYRQSPFIILDEPTSAMDPWAERDWLDRFRAMAAGKTALVITHRFTLAMRADIIHVMRAGEIVESGSHHELLAMDGLYAESWRSQMEHHPYQVFAGEPA